MVKKIIGFLCSVLFCTVIAVGMPQMAGAAETGNFYWCKWDFWRFKLEYYSRWTSDY